MKRKAAILGGTFDPIHLGHIHLFHNIYAYTPIRVLYVIPAYLSNFKRDTKPASFEERLEMLHLAHSDYREMYPEDQLEIIISDYEGKKKGVSYTSDTIREFYPLLSDEGKVNFMLGDDHIERLEYWHDFDYLKDHVRFFCFTRDGNAEKETSAEVHFINSPEFRASSTDVRGGELSLLSERVRRFALEHQLYRA